MGIAEKTKKCEINKECIESQDMIYVDSRGNNSTVYDYALTKLKMLP